MKKNIAAALLAVVALFAFAMMFVSSANAQLHATASTQGAVPSGQAAPAIDGRDQAPSVYVAGP
jgi:hypothetical protein